MLDLTKQAAQQRYGKLVIDLNRFCVGRRIDRLGLEDMLDMLDGYFQGKRGAWSPD